MHWPLGLANLGQCHQALLAVVLEEQFKLQCLRLFRIKVKVTGVGI